MGGPTNYGFDLGFGVRRGYVEMYWYTIPDLTIGQKLVEGDYLTVDESVGVIKNGTYNGEVNEEYEENWATSVGNFRYGDSTDSFVHRYFMSMMRSLQMRCTAVTVNGNLIPQMLPFISLELGRSVDDTPDIWSLMCQASLNWRNFSGTNYDGSDIEFYREITNDDKTNGIYVKNFERWLYQRDKVGYETVPAMAVAHPIEMWMINSNYYDYLARRGARIGFYADDRFDVGGKSKSVKITYLDSEAGLLELHYRSSDGSKQSVSTALQGDSQLRTVTFIIDDIALGDSGDDYDFTVEAAGEAQTVTVSMVRIVKI